MNGRELLKYLQSLNETEIGFPVTAAMPIEGAASETDDYPASHASVQTGAIMIHVPDARVPRRSHDAQYAEIRKRSGK